VKNSRSVLENSSFSISLNFDPISNPINRMPVCSETLFEGILSIVEGIQSQLPEE
jgi:hypothetical protein